MITFICINDFIDSPFIEKNRVRKKKGEVGQRERVCVLISDQAVAACVCLCGRFK